MNGIERIAQRITEDIDREIAGIQAQAKEQADAITADYATRATKEAEEIVAHGQTAAQEREERLYSMAQMEAKKAMLGAKQEMISRAFDMAMEKLCNLPEEEYVALLADLLVKAVDSGTEQVIFSQKDRARVGKAAVTRANEMLGEKGKLTLSEQTRAIKGGLILSEDAVEVNCTFEALLRQQKATATNEVAGVLFG